MEIRKKLFWVFQLCKNFGIYIKEGVSTRKVCDVFWGWMKKELWPTCTKSIKEQLSPNTIITINHPHYQRHHQVQFCHGRSSAPCSHISISCCHGQISKTNDMDNCRWHSNDEIFNILYQNHHRCQNHTHALAVRTKYFKQTIWKMVIDIGMMIFQRVLLLKGVNL